MIPVYVSSPVNDTHALGGSNTLAMDSTSAAGTVSNQGAANTTAVAHTGASFSAETDITTTFTLTPTVTTNRIFVAADFWGFKVTNAGTVTLLIYEDGVSVASTTSASIGISAYGGTTLNVTRSNLSAAGHIYKARLSASTASIQLVWSGCQGRLVDLTGSDTHALTGSAGSCQLS